MPAFSVSFNYSIETATQADTLVTVKFTLTSTSPALSEEHTEIYPAEMYYENITPTMSDDDRDAQMDSNFRTLARPTMEAFAQEVRDAAQSAEGLPGATHTSGVVAMGETQKTITVSLPDRAV